MPNRIKTRMLNKNLMLIKTVKVIMVRKVKKRKNRASLLVEKTSTGTKRTGEIIIILILSIDLGL